MRGSAPARIALAAALLAAAAVTGCYQRSESLPNVDEDARSVDERPPLALCIVPTRIAREAVLRYGPVADHLARRLGRRVEVRPAATWAIAFARLEDGSADLALLGSAAYVRARKRLGVVGLARIEELGSTSYRGAILVRPEDPALEIGDLRGRRLGLVDPESTTGGLLPLVALRDAGLGPDDLGSVRYLGRQEMVIRAIRLGEVDAGAVRESTAERNAVRGLRILWKSAPVPGPVVAARADLPEDLRVAIRHALLDAGEGILPADEPADTDDRLRFRPLADGDDAEVERLLVLIYGDSAFDPVPTPKR